MRSTELIRSSSTARLARHGVRRPDRLSCWRGQCLGRQPEHAAVRCFFRGRSPARLSALHVLLQPDDGSTWATASPSGNRGSGHGDCRGTPERTGRERGDDHHNLESRLHYRAASPDRTLPIPHSMEVSMSRYRPTTFTYAQTGGRDLGAGNGHAQVPAWCRVASEITSRRFPTSRR
jgi:hypothetical protein